MMTLAKDRQPHVVVAIPIYNGATYLATTVRSVLSQGYSPLSLYLVDDQSTDDPLAALADFPEQSYCYVQNPKRLGMVGNHARCLEFNHGDYLKVLSQDDVLMPGALARQVAALEHCQHAVFAGGAKEVIGPSGRRLLTIDHGLRGLVSRDAVCRGLARRGTNVVGEPGTVLMRGSVLRLGPTFDSTDPWLLDIHMWLALLEHGPAIMEGVPILQFRVSLESYSVGNATRQYASFVSLLARLKEKGAIGRGEFLLGKLRCKINQLGRQLVYRWSRAA